MDLRGSGEYVYRLGDKVEVAYRLSGARLYIELKGGSGFSIGGDGSVVSLVFGVAEFFLGSSCGFRRLFSVRVDSLVGVISVSRALIEDSLRSFERGFPIARTLALILVNLDRLIIEKLKGLEELELLSHRYSEVFSWAVDRLSLLVDESDKELYDFYLGKKNTLMYVKGVVLGVGELSSLVLGGEIDRYFVQLSDYKRSFRSGSFVCREGEYGDEFYILQKGVIRIWVANRAIKEEGRRGVVLGDMVFWLGGRRTASIQALTDVELIVLRKANIAKIVSSNSSFLKVLVEHLSCCLEHHCSKLEELDLAMGRFARYNRKMKLELRRFRGDLVRIMVERGDLASLLDIKRGISERLLT